jgi:hypothetical protein
MASRTKRRAPHANATLTPLRELPTGHRPRRATLVMRDKRARREGRAHQKARGWGSND